MAKYYIFETTRKQLTPNNDIQTECHRPYEEKLCTAPLRCLAQRCVLLRVPFYKFRVEQLQRRKGGVIKCLKSKLMNSDWKLEELCWTKGIREVTEVRPNNLQICKSELHWRQSNVIRIHYKDEEITKNSNKGHLTESKAAFATHVDCCTLEKAAVLHHWGLSRGRDRANPAWCIMMSRMTSKPLSAWFIPVPRKILKMLTANVHIV